MDTILKKNLSKIKFTLSVFVISSLCYIPLIANGYVNSIDGIWHSNTFFQSGNLELSSGRWAWLFLDKLKGGYAAEPFSSLVALLLISISICLALDMFMDLNIVNILLALLFSVSTSVCCFLSYRFQATSFGLSILLAILAAYLVIIKSADKKTQIMHYLCAIASLTILLGLYQANLGCYCIVIISYTM